MLFLFVIIGSCAKQNNSNEARYVVLSPEIAEILYSIGVYDEIVGYTEECVEVKDSTALNNILSENYTNKNGVETVIVGNFGNISLEKVVALSPTIVFTSALEQNEIATKLNKLKIKTIQMYPSSIKELLEMIDSLGKICEKPTQAEILIDSLLNKFDYFKKLADSRENKPKVFIEIYGNPIMTADNSSYLGKLLELSGGINIFPNLVRDYCRVNPEEVVHLNPDIIILTYPGIGTDDVKQRKGWDNVNAIKNNKIYTIEDINPDFILRAGPRSIIGIENMIKVLYEE